MTTKRSITANNATFHTPNPAAIAVIAACPFPTHQGTQVLLRHWVNGLARAGHRVSLFTYDVGEPLEGAELHPSVQWYRAPARGVGLRSGPSWARVRADAGLLSLIQRVARTTPFELIDAHNAEGLAVGTLAARRLALPLVYHAHSALGPELPTYAVSQVGRLAATAFGHSFDFVAPRSAEAVICFDEPQRRHHLRLGVPDERLHVIAPGLDMNELGSERAHGRHTVIYAGNPDGYQNLDLLRATFMTLRRDEPWWRLRILSNHSREAFGVLASNAGVDVVGYSGPCELAGLLRTGSVGISTRTLWVGAPVKVLTYLSAGLPVVACASGARILADVPDAATLTDATPEAMSEALRAAHHLNPCRARAAFDLANHLPRYEAIIAALRGVPSASPRAARRGRQPRGAEIGRPGREASPSPR